jgi:hypothetical protein
MITRRDPKSGEVTVTALEFSVLVSEGSVRILIDDAVVQEWKPGPGHADAPSPRSKPAKRGSR